VLEGDIQMARGHKKGSGERSNWYSEDKCSNWSRFDPFESEIEALPPRIRPTATVQTETGTRIAIIARDPYPEFIQPVTAEDVEATLLRVPAEFLTGLDSVYILGGTAKQDKVAFSRLARFGCYGGNMIYLHAFPRKRLRTRYKTPPSPDIVQEYTRVGATCTAERDGYVLQFSEDTLRAFYLRDVLLHEIGHHVDRSNVFRKKDAAAERYAKWFIQFCSQEMMNNEAGQRRP
jgi:hypothetical protein